MAAEEDKKGAFAPMMESGVHAGFPSPAQDYINSFIDLNKELVRHPAATFFRPCGRRFDGGRRCERG